MHTVIKMEKNHWAGSWEIVQMFYDISQSLGSWMFELWSHRLRIFCVEIVSTQKVFLEC